MSVSILAKVKEFTEFWRDRLHELYEFEKEMPPLKGDELVPEIKRAFCVASFFVEQEEQEKDRFFTDMTKDGENIPMDLKATYYELNAEIIKVWIRHIGYLRELKFCVESDNATFMDFESALDRAFDYFIDTNLLKEQVWTRSDLLSQNIQLERSQGLQQSSNLHM